MTTQELINYYANLLTLQYVGKTKNYAAIQTLVTPVVMPQTTVQTISFSAIAASGSFILSYGTHSTASIAWNDSVSTIQTKLQAVLGLNSSTVTGSIASQLLAITFTGVAPPALLLAISSNSIEDSSNNLITLTVQETDKTLPLAVQDAYNLIGNNLAQGKQLDVIGKYVGVTRTGNSSQGPITLSDSEFLNLIKLAIFRNSSGSSLAEIQNLIQLFFPGEILVFDYQNMQMSYLVSTSLGSLNFIQLAITENLIPKPMAVSVGVVIFAPNITNFFGFRTYSLPAFNAKPFNSYSVYNTTWPWLSYGNVVHL